MGDEVYLPTPVVNVLENNDEIMDAYMDLRASREPLEALEAAIRRVLSGTDRDEAISFVRGELDEKFGLGGGEQFSEVLIRQADLLYYHRKFLLEAPAGHATPRPERDIVDLAEWLAGNPQTTAMYRRALTENPELADFLLRNAVNDIVRIADTARTKFGRRTKVNQSLAVIRLLASKAMIHESEAAACQVIWCEDLELALIEARP